VSRKHVQSHIFKKEPYIERVTTEMQNYEGMEASPSQNPQ